MPILCSKAASSTSGWACDSELSRRGGGNGHHAFGTKDDSQDESEAQGRQGEAAEAGQDDWW